MTMPTSFAGGSAGETPDDRAWLRRAIELGRRGWGQVAPNPMVGCVLVVGNEVVGEGWHQVYGGPHAEVVALGAAGNRARGATAYVSLEPCRHEGKTPPCSGALISAGVARVVYGAADPGSDSGGGGRELSSSGIEVLGPLMTPDEAARENPAFFHTDPDRPWLEVKLAISLDGRIAAREGHRTQLTGGEATAEVHRLRAGFDAILVGSRTARVDDPILTVRGPVLPRIPPRRIVVDSTGQTDPGGRLFTIPGGKVMVLTTESAPEPWRTRIEVAGGEVLLLPQDGKGRVHLKAALRRLRDEGVRSLLCEGGAGIVSSLLRDGSVDRLHLLTAPIFLGSEGVAAFDPAELVGANLEERWRQFGDPKSFGEDLWVSYERGHS